MKKIYFKPEMEIELLNRIDIVTTSGKGNSSDLDTDTDSDVILEHDNISFFWPFA